MWKTSEAPVLWFNLTRIGVNLQKGAESINVSTTFLNTHKRREAKLEQSQAPHRVLAGAGSWDLF